VRFPSVLAGSCVLVLTLAGCGQGAPESAETMLEMPASPTPEAGATAAPSPQGDPAAGGAPRGTEQPTGSESASKPSDHCVLVAGGVTTAMLAPLSFRSETDPGELVALEEQILDLREKLPTDLHDDFTTLAHSVEAPPKGSGTFDEKAFRHAMIPVQDWLAQHCTRP
jgi:hypothetical protein